jgi:hypothetical protein
MMLRSLAVLLLAVSAAWADYSFDFFCRDDTVASVAPGDPVDFDFTLSNTGTSPDVYEFDCRVLGMPADWVAVYCLGGRCVEPGTLMTDSVAAGATDTAIVVHVYTSATAGEGRLELHVRSFGNPGLADSIRMDVLAGVGIAEELVALSLPEPTVPSLVRRGATLPVDGSVSLLDVTGRLVARGSGQGGQWTLPADIPPGVYLVGFETDGVRRSARVVAP